MDHQFKIKINVQLCLVHLLASLLFCTRLFDQGNNFFQGCFIHSVFVRLLPNRSAAICARKRDASNRMSGSFSLPRLIIAANGLLFTVITNTLSLVSCLRNVVGAMFWRSRYGTDCMSSSLCGKICCGCISLSPIDQITLSFRYREVANHLGFALIVYLIADLPTVWATRNRQA